MSNKRWPFLRNDPKTHTSYETLKLLLLLNHREAEQTQKEVQSALLCIHKLTNASDWLEAWLARAWLTSTSGTVNSLKMFPFRV